MGQLANEEGGPETVKERKRKERERKEKEAAEMRAKEEKEARERRVREENERKERRKRKRMDEGEEEEEAGEVMGDSDPFKEHFFTDIDEKVAAEHQELVFLSSFFFLSLLFYFSPPLPLLPLSTPPPPFLKKIEKKNGPYLSLHLSWKCLSFPRSQRKPLSFFLAY